MTDRPMLMSAPMVRAMIANTKTETRRLVKPAPVSAPRHPLLSFNRGVAEYSFGPDDRTAKGDLRWWRCPHGMPGDTIWIREACRAEELSRPAAERVATRRERQETGRTSVIELDELDGADGVRYLADDEWRPIQNTADAAEAWSVMFYYRGRGKGRLGNQVPPIHMPRWACRLTREIAAVRVERLHDITADGARAEGIVQLREPDADGTGHWGLAGAEDGYPTAVRAYRALWSTIHGPDSWDANPWVWVVQWLPA